ncbi:hypothetical protein S7711_04901 [Stachybotrys chartarum IBT 7711]|uniref:FAD-binding FR-type domain-containing protein n=1 Tax=Stachybotrys chartarum (strain CBS 109288 / IBT 7711) TaxID=1280523 RepID=A0A084AUY9_STACB|nr:hypothetical protein S7711_04901 [Stachybotrys chartarum IBT 7711]
MLSRVAGWHQGEEAMHQLLKVPSHDNPTVQGLPRSYAMRVTQSPLVALGTIDAEGRPWTSIWGGERGFAQPVAQGVLGFNSGVDTQHDPVFGALWNGSGEVGKVVEYSDVGGRVMSALAIDLDTRDRVKLAGRMIAGAQTGEQEAQMAMLVTESLGNCPKYLNRKKIEPHDVRPELVADGLPLPTEAVDLLDKADVWFISSTNGETMDTNVRGGMPGFTRVLKNAEDGVQLVYPEYSGNRLYQSLGNIKSNPLVGLVVPDFDTSNVLYLTGSASILLGKEASSLISRTKLAVKISVTSARFVKSGLPVRGSFLDYSPYSPPVRRLVNEKDTHIPAPGAQRSDTQAEFLRRETITPTISRLTFRLSSKGARPTWHAGQYVTLDFSRELDVGYSHMREDDPQSLNDDYVRTFTISSPPVEDAVGDVQVEITARKHGPVTEMLWKHAFRVPLEFPVLGFGGEENFRLPTAESTAQPVFIAGGVGITPLLAQAGHYLAASPSSELRVLWSLSSADLALAEDTFTRIKGVAAATTVFVTGREAAEEGVVQRLRDAGAEVVERRMGRGDVDGLKWEGTSKKWYLCTGPGLLKQLEEWLAGEEVVWESFGY